MAINGTTSCTDQQHHDVEIVAFPAQDKYYEQGIESGNCLPSSFLATIAMTSTTIKIATIMVAITIIIITIIIILIIIIITTINKPKLQ